MAGDKTDSSSFSAILASVARMRQEAGGDAQEPQKRVESVPKRVEPPQAPGFQSARQAVSAQTRPTIPKSAIPESARQQVMRGQSARSAHYQATRGTNFRKQTTAFIQVNKHQEGNDLLNHLKNVSYKFAPRLHDVDYLVNSHCAVLFLSVKYHKLHPEYIHRRIGKLGYNPSNKQMMRILLVLVDVDGANEAVRELNRICVHSSLTMLVGWSFEQCADYLTALKQCELNEGKKIIQGTAHRSDDMNDDTNYYKRAVEVLTSIKGINKTDAVNLLTNFGTLEKLFADATPENLEMVHGMGERKIDNLLAAINEPFVYK